MAFWQGWLRQPQRVWLRRASFQIHLWIGLAIGLYIVMLSITGSVLVYRNELDRFFATPRPPYDANRKVITQDELRAFAERAYPGYEITRLGDRISRRNPTLEVWVERDGVKKERLFNPYTGEDLGDSVTQGEYFVLWLARLHDDLLLDREGRFWNGILSAVCNRALHHRHRRLVAGRQPLEAKPRREAGRRVEALQLGSPQRARLLAVPVHADVGSLRLLSGRARAVLEFRGLDLRSRCLPWRPSRRHRAVVADAPALRAMAGNAVAEGVLGVRRSGSRADVRHRRRDVVEPRAAPAADQEEVEASGRNPAASSGSEIMRAWIVPKGCTSLDRVAARRTAGPSRRTA